LYILLVTANLEFFSSSDFLHLDILLFVFAYSHELRVVLYEKRNSTTAEYRLSSMERLILFSDDVPLLEQICARLRHVYCDIRDTTRTLIVLEDTDLPSFDSKFEVDGEEEYEIRSQASDVGM